MASNQTQHLKLCQWEADDEVLRVDFNADNAKIDAAVTGVEQKLSTSVAAVEKKIQAAQTQAATAVQAAERKIDTVQSQLAASVKTVEDKVAAETARAKAAESALTAAAEDTAAYIGNCIVVTGTYKGTGGYGSSHYCGLSFPYKPMLVLLEKDFILRRGVTTTVIPFGSSTQQLHVSWGSKSVTWYSYNGTSEHQCNLSGTTYHYVAFLVREEDLDVKGTFEAK